MCAPQLNYLYHFFIILMWKECTSNPLLARRCIQIIFCSLQPVWGISQSSILYFACYYYFCNYYLFITLILIIYLYSLLF